MKVKDDPTQALPILRALSTSVNFRALYPQNHPKVVEGVDAMVDSLADCLRQRGQDSITFLVIENELLVDHRPIRAGHLYLTPLIRTMSRLGVDRLTLAAGLDQEEGHRLIEGLASIGQPESSPHVIFGRIQLAGGLGPPGDDDGDDRSGHEVSQFSEKDIDRAQESFIRYREDRSGSIGQLDRMLWHFVEGMDHSSRSLLLLEPMKSLDQRLFIHAINVSMLVLAQARSLGITGQSLHTIGLAAMLHDIGKLSLPAALLDRDEELSDVEWEILKMHTVLGAAQLCGLPEAPPLAVLVAYEHHLRWDGKPSYPVPATPRRPNLISQLTAIADTYDVMVESRGFTGGVHGDAATTVWKERTETYLDPFLVGNFVLMVAGAEHEL